MKLLKYFFACLLFLLASPALASFDNNLSSRLSGRILIDVENKGEAWYIYPGDFHRYYLGGPDDAYNLMRNLSLGISNENFSKIEKSAPDRFKGIILLKPEDLGKAYYVSPIDKSFNYLASAKDAFKLMQKDSLGITAGDLKTIPIGKIILNDLGTEISREWQYLGFWGSINQDYVPVLSEPKTDSSILGKFYKGNTVKILNIKKADGRIWYQLDGGKYPGAYIDAIFLNAAPQPTVNKKIVIPKEITINDYWIDVNLSNKVLVLYKYDQVVLATYVSIGAPETPTITGAYHVWYKIKDTRMKSNPLFSSHAYDLANVPWVMYYSGSYSIHGTYWHDNFGTQRSAGCTNVTIGDAEYIYNLTNPVTGNNDLIFSSSSNPGVLVVNHY